MMHLNEEQFEQALRQAPSTEASEHLAGCGQCSRELKERQALRVRLQETFAGIHMPVGLEARIRRQLAATNGRGAGGLLVAAGQRKVWPMMAAAAALLVMALPLALYFATTSPAEAAVAQQQLVGIHKMNLSDAHGFYTEDEPGKLADYFRNKLGFVPAMPKLNQGMALRGCCVAHFRDQVVGSYVVNTPRGVISVIVVKDTPEAMGMKLHSARGDQKFWSGAFASNSLAAVRMDEFTYCAVGETPAGPLVDLLADLVPQESKSE